MPFQGSYPQQNAINKVPIRKRGFSAHAQHTQTKFQHIVDSDPQRGTKFKRVKSDFDDRDLSYSNQLAGHGSGTFYTNNHYKGMPERQRRPQSSKSGCIRNHVRFTATSSSNMLPKNQPENEQSRRMPETQLTSQITILNQFHLQDKDSSAYKELPMQLDQQSNSIKYSETQKAV